MRHPRDEGEDSGVPGAGEGEPFLRRWSRRKRGLDQEPAGEVVETDPAPPEAEPAPVLTDAEMPDLSTIGDESDVSPFFSPGVSDDLRQAALKRLFRGSKFNIRDGLDDYDEDYRNFEALGDIVTTEMQRQQERLEARLREAEARAETGGGAGDETREEAAGASQDTAGPVRFGSVSSAAPDDASLARTATHEDATDGDGHERG